MSKRVGLHDVAKLAGVSLAAVSRAYTPGASISDATRDRVLKAAQKLEYRPNLLARSLIKGKSGIIGVVMGNPRHPVFAIALDALSRRLSQAGKHILIFTAGEHDHTADVHVEDLLKYRVDALLLMAASLSAKLAERCREAGIPVVLFHRLSQKGPGMVNVPGMVRVTGGDRTIGRKIAEHLLQQGYRRLAFMGDDRSKDGELESGFSAHVTSKGFPAPQRVVGHSQREGAVAAARTLLSQNRRPGAIFCISDYMAMATIEVARYEFGLTIGRDLGVVGYDDTEQASWPSYDLTTYSHPIDPIIEKIVALLLQDPTVKHSSHINIEGALKFRGSTKRT